MPWSRQVRRRALAAEAKVRSPQASPQGFVVDKVAMGQGFLQVRLNFSPLSIIPPMLQSHSSTIDTILSHQLTKLLNKAHKTLTQPILKQTHIFDFNLVLLSSKHKVSEGITASVIRQKNEIWKLLFWVTSIGDQRSSLKNMCLFLKR